MSGEKFSRKILSKKNVPRSAPYMNILFNLPGTHEEWHADDTTCVADAS